MIIEWSAVTAVTLRPTFNIHTYRLCVGKKDKVSLRDDTTATRRSHTLCTL